jgi:hypothetical protein
MRELQLILSDDLAFSVDGSRVPADETVVIALDGKTRELDLTTENAKFLRDLLEPYIKAGHVPGQPSANKAGAGPVTSLVTARARQKLIRDWADSLGLKSEDGKRPIYRTESGGYYYPYELMHRYEAYQAAEAERQGGNRTDYA